MRTYIIFIFAAPFFLISASPAFSASVEDSVVKIFTSFNSPNYDQPWQMRGQSSKSGSGCVIEGNRILTNAHVVSDHTFVQVQRAGDPDKFTARVTAIGHECDLAILELEDRSFFKNISPLRIGDLPRLRDKIVVYGFPIGGTKLSITEGVVSRIEMNRYAHSRRTLLVMQIDAALNPGNSGGPVLRKGSIAGIASQVLNSGENVGYCIPPMVISHFLEDIKDGTHDGFPSLGIVYQRLENPSYRTSLGMKEGQTGIVLTRIIAESSAWKNLKKHDVLLSLNGIAVANDGTIPFRKKDRINLGYLITKAHIGDSLSVKILRDGKEQKFNISLKSAAQIIPEFEHEKKPDYFIFGGIVFTKLTFDYFNSHSNDAALAYHYFYDAKTAERKDFVVLSSVLADTVNFGYHSYRTRIVETVNGSSISDFADFVKKVEQAEGDHLKIALENDNTVVLDIAAARKANPEILKRYGIPSDRTLQSNTP